jgi:uncharacterized protein (TIGR02246 family)
MSKAYIRAKTPARAPALHLNLAVMTLEEAISAFRDAWNRHNADEMAAMWTGDGELDHPWGLRAVGRDAIARVLNDEHRGNMAETTLELGAVTSRASGDTFSTDLDGMLRGVKAPNGRTYDLPLKIAVMFVKEDGEWRIRTMAPVANPK